MAEAMTIRKLQDTRITLITQGDDEHFLMQVASAMVQGLRDYLKPCRPFCGIHLEQEKRLRILKKLEHGTVCLGRCGELHAHVEFSRGFYDNEHFLDVCVVFEKPRNQLEVRRR
jgi:hypothetical protein